MNRAGFVLAGGRSTRMGRDKALLPLGEQSLLEYVAGQVREAAGWVGIVGAPERYGTTGLPAYHDLQPDCGPIGGLETALSLGIAEWNLIVACDMPGLRVEDLRSLFAHIPKIPKQLACVAAKGPTGPEPLCAVYHASCAAAVQRAIAQKRFKLRELLAGLNTLEVPAMEPQALANVNTPAEWAALRGGTGR